MSDATCRNFLFFYFVFGIERCIDHIVQLRNNSIVIVELPASVGDLTVANAI